MADLQADGYVRFDDDTPINEAHGRITHSINCNESSVQDMPNEVGSQSNLTRGGTTYNEFSSNAECYYAVNHHWEMNYHEAAIFLEEGQNNEKFDSHPREPAALPAYLLVHNPWYYGLDLATSLVLLALALVEDPAVPLFELPVLVHGLIELVALTVIGAEVMLKLRWIGWSTILKHKRTMLKCITLTIMLLEALIVLVRQSSHFRVTRALRPIFLVDTRHFGGVRRCIRQILQSMPPIFDMLALIFFFVSIYAILGHFLFAEMPNSSYFSTLFDSFVTMFVLLTTANFPDVMMPAYAVSKWYSLFFISYLCVCLYVLMNLMLAVVYETFTNIEREKFRRLLLHKREACHHAFSLLTTKQSPTNMRFRQFEGLMRYFATNKSIRDVLLMFKYLNTSNTGVLSLDEFCQVYDAVAITWEVQYADIPWFHSAWMPLQQLCQLMHNLVMWTHFETVVFVIVVCNGLSIIYRSFETYPDLQTAGFMFLASWDALLFLSLQILEIVIKTLGLGMSHYIHSGWNFYDLLVTCLALIALLTIYLVPTFTYGVFIRPLRLLHLFKMKKRYRDIIGTLALLTPLMCSTGLVMLVLYYFFAIIGMELFDGYDMRNCCKGTSVEEFYAYSVNGTSALGYYYLNTFENLVTSYVTLFELTVVNNWFIMMTGYASVVHPLSRVYFILFYLTTMVVLTIVVASVLEAFRFRIQYKRHTTKRDEEKLLHEEIDLKWEDIQSWGLDFHIMEKLRSELVVGGTATFVGVRSKTREILQKRMYRSEIEQWMKEASPVIPLSVTACNH